MKFEEIKCIGILGAGVMGGGIAQNAIQAGQKVIVRDLSDEICEKAKDIILNSRFGFNKAVELGKMTLEERDGQQYVPLRLPPLGSLSCSLALTVVRLVTVVVSPGSRTVVLPPPVPVVLVPLAIALVHDCARVAACTRSESAPAAEWARTFARVLKVSYPCAGGRRRGRSPRDGSVRFSLCWPS